MSSIKIENKLVSDDDIPKWDRNCHLQLFQDLLDGWGDNNKSPTIDFVVKGFIGKKYVSDSSTVSFVKERNGWFCFICRSPIMQVSQETGKHDAHFFY
jgi:hypothetical protein